MLRLSSNGRPRGVAVRLALRVSAVIAVIPVIGAITVITVITMLSGDARASEHAIEPAGPRAEEHLRRGLALRKDARDAEALTEFQIAYELLPTGRVRAQIALAEQALGRWVAAESDLKKALESPDSWIAAHRQTLEQSVEFIDGHLGWLAVECNVGGAELRINGTVVGHFPLEAPLRIVTGSALVHVEAEGYLPIERAVAIDPKEHAREYVELAPRATAPVDAPKAAASVPPAAAPPREISAVENGLSPGRVIGLVTSAGIGVAALGVTSYFGIDAMVTEARRPQRCSIYDTACAESARSLEERRATDTTIATIGAGVTAAAAVTAIVLIVLPRPTRPREAAWTFAPFADAGLSVFARF